MSKRYRETKTRKIFALEGEYFHKHSLFGTALVIEQFWMNRLQCVRPNFTTKSMNDFNRSCLVSYFPYSLVHSWLEGETRPPRENQVVCLGTRTKGCFKFRVEISLIHLSFWVEKIDRKTNFPSLLRIHLLNRVYLL